jgi:uncharacterized membrane protein YhaH (DUF805 family)
MHYYIRVLRKYAVFTGRSGRKEFWYFILFNLIVFFTLDKIGFLLNASVDSSDHSILAEIYNLMILSPVIGVWIRRMHDVNKSGWHMLIPFYNFMLACAAGTTGMNDYGPDPKGGIESNNSPASQP